MREEKFNPFESSEEDLIIANEAELAEAKKAAGVVTETEHLHRMLASNDSKLQAYSKQKLAEIRRSLSELPKWAGREIDTRTLDFHRLPVGWEALRRMRGLVAELSGRPWVLTEWHELRLPPEVYPAVPMVASVVANKRNPEIPIVLPDESQVKAMKPWLEKLQKFIGGFSQKWAISFGRYVERRGRQTILDAGLRLISIADVFHSIPKPREQFLKELFAIYQELAKPQVRREEDWFGISENIVPIEEKIIQFFFELQRIGLGNSSKRFPPKSFPILNQLLPKFKFPSPNFDFYQASIAGAELMDGLHEFLKRRGFSVLDAPKAQEFDLFDIGSWGRAVAEIFASDRLEAVKRKLPELLECVFEALPADGESFSTKIYETAENVCALKTQGKTAAEIAGALFPPQTFIREF
jgi:hypothetical protein